MRVPVISLYDPWASWVGFSWKKIETRTHDKLKSLLGKTIGIHVAKTWDIKALVEAGPYLTPDQILQTQTLIKTPGVIRWTARVAEHRKLTASDSPLALIDCEHTERWGLFLEDVQVIKPIYINGKQGIWYTEIL